MGQGPVVGWAALLEVEVPIWRHVPQVIVSHG